MHSQRGRTIAAFISIALPILLFFLRLVYPAFQVIITPDFGQSDAVTGLSTKLIYSTAIQHHTIPFWSSKIGGGYPIYANGAMGVWYIPNMILFYMLPLAPAYILSLFLCLLLLGWGVYSWLRSFSIGRLASVFGGITASLCGYGIVQFTHLTIVQSISLFPWILLLCHLIVTNPKRRYIFILAVLYSQLIFIGFAQSIFITSLFMITYVLWLAYVSHRLVRSIASVGVACTLGILLSAIHLLPALEFLRQLDSGGVFSPDAATLFSYPFSHLISLLNPYALGNPVNGTYPHFFAFNGSIFWENTAYIGIIPIVFCVIGGIFFIQKNKNRIKHNIYMFPFFLVAAAVALLLMTGRNSPFYFIYTFFPFTLFRVPSRFIWIFIISMIIMASYVFDELLVRIKSPRTRTLIGIFIVLVQVCNSLYLFSGYHNTEPATEWLQSPSFAQYLNPGYTVTIGGETAFNSAYLHNGWMRTDPNDRPSYILRNTFTPDKNLLWNVAQIRDYSGREFKRSKVMNDLLSQTITSDSGHATVSATGEKLLSLYGISNVISTLQLTHQGLVQKAVLSDPHMQITLFHNPTSLPKAYIATDTTVVTTISEAVKTLISDAFIPGTSALVDHELQASISGSPSTLKIEKQSEGQYILSITPVDHDTLVVVTENYYPGWNATVDGRTVTPISVNVSQLGVVVPKGATNITLSFVPKYFTRGLWISAITLILITIAGVFLLFF